MTANKEIVQLVKYVTRLDDTNKNKIACIVAERFLVKAENLREL
ncbi:hypothetical protein MHH45_05655 [Bacillus sp. FSL K6-0042]|nr:hypothetical protein [Bacillus pseudomycoides]